MDLATGEVTEFVTTGGMLVYFLRRVEMLGAVPLQGPHHGKDDQAGQQGAQLRARVVRPAVALTDRTAGTVVVRNHVENGAWTKTLYKWFKADGTNGGARRDVAVSSRSSLDALREAGAVSSPAITRCYEKDVLKHLPEVERQALRGRCRRRDRRVRRQGGRHVDAQQIPHRHGNATSPTTLRGRRRRGYRPNVERRTPTTIDHVRPSRRLAASPTAKSTRRRARRRTRRRARRRTRRRARRRTGGVLGGGLGGLLGGVLGGVLGGELRRAAADSAAYSAAYSAARSAA